MRDVRLAVLPIAAALGGMSLPALIYLAINARFDDGALRTPPCGCRPRRRCSPNLRACADRRRARVRPAEALPQAVPALAFRTRPGRQSIGAADQVR
ncbi:Na+/H+ antiporter NhaA [Micromonospora sp. CPCC 205714]|uniref:Na+/H+ antiporter NhaA n=1 Tax=unclassified Micromonospora TaxID=2617518 RepID=UPI002FF3D549